MDPASAQYIAARTGIIEKIDKHLQFSRDYEEIRAHEPVWQSAGMMVDRAKSDLAPTQVEIVAFVPQVRIYTDPIFVKVVYNLLENALRHGGAGLTRVMVSAEKREGGISYCSSRMTAWAFLQGRRNASSGTGSGNIPVLA